MSAFGILLRVLLLISFPAHSAQVIYWISDKLPVDVSSFQSRWHTLKQQSLDVRVLSLTEAQQNNRWQDAWFVISDGPHSDLWMTGQTTSAWVFSTQLRRQLLAILQERREQRRWSAIWADAEPSQLIQTASAVDVDIYRIGAVFGADSLALKSEWENAAQKKRRKLESLYPRPFERVERVLPLLLPRADVLIVPAQGPSSRMLLPSAIVLLATQHGVPVITGDAAWQNAGSLLALLPDRHHTQQQLANLVARVMQQQRNEFESPRYLTLHYNQHVARTLGITLSKSGLVKQLPFIEQTAGMP